MALTTVLRTNVLHCDVVNFWRTHGQEWSVLFLFFFLAGIYTTYNALKMVSSVGSQYTLTSDSECQLTLY